jgi:urease accessory protein
MRAVARIVAAAGGRLTTLYGEPPLLPRRTGPGEVHLVGGAAGPLGGDDLRIEIEVGPGADLRVRTVAASLALPGPGGGSSRTRVSARVATGGRLAWLPEPLIAAAGCDHDAVSTIDVAAGAHVVWREELVCGRHGETPGDARLRLAVRLGGRPLHRHELAVGPNAPGWDGAAVLGDARAVGTVLIIGECPAGPMPLGPTAAVLPLAGPAVVAVATGADLREVRAALEGGDPF